MKRLLPLGWFFFWVSTVTLGGGMAMLPFMEREFVERRKWLTADEMVDVVAVMQSLPGLIAVNMAVLIGYRVKGVVGALVAAFCSVLSPFAVILLVAQGMTMLSGSPTADHVFLGVRAGAAALIFVSLFKLSKQVLKGPLAWVLGTAGFVAAVVLKVDVTYVIAFGFAVGVSLVIAQALREARK